MTGDFGLGLDLLDGKGAANAITTTGTFPFGTTADSNEAPHITHDLESYIFLLWVVGVNFKGPYNQVEHWPSSSKAAPIPNNSMSNSNASNLISSKLHLPTFQWPGKGGPPSSTERFPATQRTPINSGDEEFERRNAMVPEWAKMGSLQLRTGPVFHQKKFLDYETFKVSLHPYWKVGALMDGWSKLFNLLWPTTEDACMISVKRSSLTHAALIGVIREMILLIPPADDGAPSKAVVDDARQRYSLSIKRLVNFEKFKFISPVVLHPYDAAALMLPPSSDPSRATTSPALSPYRFVEFNLDTVRRTSQKRPSDTPTSGPLPQAGNSSRQNVRRSDTVQTSAGNASGSRASGRVSGGPGKHRKV